MKRRNFWHDETEEIIKKHKAQSEAETTRRPVPQQQLSPRLKRQQQMRLKKQAATIKIQTCLIEQQQRRLVAAEAKLQQQREEADLRLVAQAIDNLSWRVDLTDFLVEKLDAIKWREKRTESVFIGDLDTVEVLEALFDATQPEANTFYSFVGPQIFDRAVARRAVQGPVEHFCGRPIMIDFRHDSIDPSRYDKMAGKKGTCARVVRRLRSMYSNDDDV
jgi:hypothetical protein